MFVPHINLINASKNTILKALEISNNSAAASKYVADVYKNCDKRGMFKKVQKQARNVLALCEKHGLTAEHPVKYVKEDGVIRTYGVIMGCEFIAPLFSN